MPLQATSGAASYDAFGGGVPVAVNYIEDVFSAYIYTNNTYPSNLTITNGIDLSGKGGLVWMKNRSLIRNHNLYDTARGALKQLRSDGTDGNITNASGYGLTAFNANGFSLGTDIDGENYSNVASWTFRKQPKFFDVVTWTSTTTTNTNLRVSHNLGSVPGCIIIKATSTTDSWYVYHRTLGINQYVRLNATSAVASNTPTWGTSDPTSTDFGFNENLFVSSAPTTYVAYLFAHDAGGFGLTGTDNVISCGSYTGNGSEPNGPVINLGFEPQYVLIKKTSGAAPWLITDNMRGMTVGNVDSFLQANASDAEANYFNYMSPTATGFQIVTADSWFNTSGGTYIYIAIRRGPMKVPTDGTSVFSPVAYTGDGSTRLYSVGFPTDLSINSARSLSLRSPWWADRLRGGAVQIFSNGAGAEGAGGDFVFDYQTSIYVSAVRIASGETYIDWCFKRAPSFFDEVCYTGTGANTTVTHNLTVAPELMIIKGRSDATAWEVYCSALANTEYLVLNTTAAKATGATRWNSTTPTSSVFSVGTSTTTNNSASTYVAYLFATCAGVSKVFSYTGNGSSQTINCGFTGGARFVLIKRTDSTGDWYVWDSSRGIVSGNDPHLSLNTTAAEVTSDDTIDTDSTGFVVNQVAATNVNVSSATYIGLAIA